MGVVQVEKQLNSKPGHFTKFVCANFDKFAICFVCVCCLCECVCVAVAWCRATACCCCSSSN